MTVARTGGSSRDYWNGSLVSRDATLGRVQKWAPRGGCGVRDRHGMAQSWPDSQLRPRGADLAAVPDAVP